MLDKNVVYQNVNDVNGNPAGGTFEGVGIKIEWQNGPLGRHDSGCIEGHPCVQGCTRVSPNGAFVETVIFAAKQRLEYYQESKFNCRENAIAITKLEEALMWLNKRTSDRERREVEGTHIK